MRAVLKRFAERLPGAANIGKGKPLHVPQAKKVAVIGGRIALEGVAHGFMPANLPGKLPGDPPRNVAPMTYQIIFLEVETLGPDDLIAAGMNQLNKERMIGQPRIENIGNRVTQDQLGLVGMTGDPSGRMRRHDGHGIQRAKADRHVLDQRSAEHRQSTGRIHPARWQQHETGQGTSNPTAAVAQWLHNARRRLTAGKDLADLSQSLNVKADIECAFQTMPAGLKSRRAFSSCPSDS